MQNCIIHKATLYYFPVVVLCVIESVVIVGSSTVTRHSSNDFASKWLPLSALLQKVLDPLAFVQNSGFAFWHPVVQVEDEMLTDWMGGGGGITLFKSFQIVSWIFYSRSCHTAVQASTAHLVFRDSYCLQFLLCIVLTWRFWWQHNFIPSWSRCC